MENRFAIAGRGLPYNTAGLSASSSTTTTAGGSGAISVQEYAVRVPKNSKKRFHVMRFHATLNVDVAKWSQVKMERENNLKDFKADEEMPKFGAGSEYGREAREEARRKKFGYTLKKYNPDDQPWLLKLGGKAGKKYRGLREGGVSENASYYVFVKAPDGAFEAYPVEEWYNFSAVQRYKTLNAEEAEEEFGRRDKVLNYFSIMLRKRLKNEDDGEKDPEEAEKPKKKPSKYGMGTGELKISDQDEWIHSSEEESEEEGVAEDAADSKPKDKKKPAGKNKGKKKKKKGSDEDEPLEDSDDGDGEGREVDYISDEESSEEEVVEEKNKQDMQGVEDEDGMRKMHDSESEEENEEEKKKENTEENPSETPPAKVPKDKKDSKKTASSSDSSSDTSDSDDFDSDTNFQSPMFMQSSKKKKDGSRPSSRANTPTKPLDGSKKSRSHKRKAAAEEGGSQAKRAKSQPSSASSSQQSTSSSRPSPSPYADLSNDGITEDAVRRYLTRKPMTTTELLHKFKSKKTGLSREQMVNTIAQILKRLDPEKQMVKGKMYLSIK